MPKGVSRKQYSGKFKQKVIEDMRLNNLSNCEVARKYEINERQVRNWERIYLTEGAESLYIERRGRSSKASGVQKGRPAKFPIKVEEDLLDEVQRLRAENEYLKKLHALVSERVQREKNQKSFGN